MGEVIKTLFSITREDTYHPYTTIIHQHVTVNFGKCDIFNHNKNDAEVCLFKLFQIILPFFTEFVTIINNNNNKNSMTK